MAIRGLVKTVSGLVAGGAERTVARGGGNETRAIGALRLHVIEVPPQAAADGIMQRFSNDQQVERVGWAQRLPFIV
jgi:hypothetical protein